jgi:nitrite reductase/ring-hydroxylating ferredoxin subunit
MTLRRSSCLWLCALLWTLIACDADSTISRENRCRFTFSYQDHPSSKLFVAVQNPGSYAFVWTKGDGKTISRHVYVLHNEQGAETEDNIIRTAPENQLEYTLGASNEIGLIIGASNFNGLQAYDRVCPNCAIERALQWTGNRQQVVCNECQRTYALETGGIIAGDEGSPLKRYNCSFNGMALNAWN